MFIFITIVIAIPFVFLLVGALLSAPVHKGPVTDHFDGKRFINPTGVKAKGIGDVMKWMYRRKREPWSKRKDIAHGPAPVDRNDVGLRITFVNHSTFLIQTRGLNILTDPVWSTRVSPFTFLGPERMRPPGLHFDQLPKIDLILLSHNHYDHLDISTIKKLWKRDQPTIVTALGIAAFLNKHQITKVTELDWWGTTSFDPAEITAVPAQHFSSRGTLDRDGTLWCGFVLKLDSEHLYFAGDTGYNPRTFKEIGSKFENIRLALVPIGAYKPEWFMSPIHCSPDEAVKIHQDVKARQSIATHFGTFPLADDGQDEPVKELLVSLEKRGLSKRDFMVLQEGVPHDL